MAVESTLNQGLAGRYATAVFELAQEEKSVEALERDFAALKAMIESSEDLARLVRAPLFSREEQSAGLAALLEKMDAAPLTRRFLQTLIQRRRLFAVTEIIRAFTALVAKMRGEVTAEVTSARALKDAEIGQLKAVLRTQLGREPKLETKVDPTLLGGLVVKVGSRMIDSSLRTRLNGLRNAMRG